MIRHRIAALLLGSLLAATGAPVLIGPTGAAGKTAGKPVTAHQALPRSASERAIKPPVTTTRSGAAERSRAVDSGQMEILLSSIKPKAPDQNSTIRISGELVNGTDKRVSDLSVWLRFSLTPLVSRSQLQAFSNPRNGPVGPPIYETQVEVADLLAPGDSARFNIRANTADLGLGGFGVYPMAVEALSGYEQVALQRTFLPFVPKGPLQPKPTRVAWIWPLVEVPRRMGGNSFVDNGEERALAPQGRLGRIVGAGGVGQESTPITWVVDPSLLDSAQRMADGYMVRWPKTTVQKEPSEIAQTWLSNVRDTTEGEEVISLPYADPDLMALHRAGLDRSLNYSIKRGRPITEEILQRDVVGDVIWPPSGWIDQDTLDSLTVTGVRTAILNNRALPPDEQLTYTPDAVATTPTVGGHMDVLVFDQMLSDILGRDTKTQSDSVLTEQRFLAETALITAERPYQERSILIAPPRRWSPSVDFAAAILRDTASVPWMKPVPLDQLRDGAGESARQGTLHYPRLARAEELGQRYLKRVAEMNADAENLANILSPRPDALDLAILRTESSAWRNKPDRRDRLQRAVDQMIDRRRERVHIVTTGPLLLASSTGTVPITVANDLRHRAAQVRLAVNPDNPSRLEVGEFPQKITINPERKTTVKVPMTAVTAGVSEVVLQLRSTDGKRYGPPVEVKVRATAYGTAAVVITASALGIFVLAIGVRVVRRAMRSTREKREEPEESDAEPETPEDAEPMERRTR